VTILRSKQFYIGGQWVDPIAPNDLDVIDPSTERPFATISLGSAADCDRAVASASAALADWASTDAADRRALVVRILAQYEKRKEDLAQAMSQEMGAPIDFARNS